jgi:hypothetical protein
MLPSWLQTLSETFSNPVSLPNMELGVGVPTVDNEHRPHPVSDGSKGHKPTEIPNDKCQVGSRN